MSKKTELAKVNNPSHYNAGEFEAIDVIEDVIQFYPPEHAFSVGNVIGYLVRAPHKGEMLTDLKKSQWYLNRLVMQMEKA